MSYEPRKNIECFYSTKDGKWRKVLLQEKPDERIVSVLWEVIKASPETSESVDVFALKVIWYETSIPMDPPFYIWGVTMEEITHIATRLSPYGSRSFEIHSQSEGFMFKHRMTHIAPTKWDRLTAGAGV